MHRGWVLATAIALLLAGATRAASQNQGCIYEGESYPEGSAVCQSGLTQTCMNGIWQSLDGQRCDADEDREREPSEDLDPQGGFEVE